MDALIMAAGRGSRLATWTADRPKALVDLGSICPMELQIDVLATRGVGRVIVVTGYLGELVEAAVRARVAARMEVEIVYNPFWSVCNVVGSVWLASE